MFQALGAMFSSLRSHSQTPFGKLQAFSVCLQTKIPSDSLFSSDNRELKKRHFWAADVNQKFIFLLSARFHARPMGYKALILAFTTWLLNEKSEISIKEEKSRLPVDVRGTKTSVLKLSSDTVTVSLFFHSALTLLTPLPLPKGILLCSHQETEMAARRTQRSTFMISRENRVLNRLDLCR